MEYADEKGGQENVATLEVQCMEAIILEKALDLPLHLYVAVEGQVPALRILQSLEESSSQICQRITQIGKQVYNQP